MITISVYSYRTRYNILRFFIEDLLDNANYSMSFCFVRFYAEFFFVAVFVVILSKTKKAK